jgi:hypothetical protein
MNYLKTFLPYLFGNKKGKSLDTPLPNPIPWSDLSFEEILMFHTLQNSINQYVHTIDLKSLSKKDLFHLFNFLDYLNQDLRKQLVPLFTEELILYYQSTTAAPLIARELQALLDFKNQKLTVFALLKADRTKPGVLLVRAPDGHFMTNKSHHVWSIPILGLSRRGLPFNHSNGCTPTGVYTLDAVMPLADKNFEFGEFKRLIVNFIKASPDEIEARKLLPKDHHQLNWWKPSVVGRELGRSLLRIHGTGRKNLNPLTSFYPFVPTSGCLATNESAFFGLKKARDQRLLLDTLMSALNMPPSDDNESKIHGLLYVVELDDNLSALRFLS